MFSKKKSFKEVKKPVGDESCFLFDDEESERKVKAKNSRLRVKRKPMVKTMSIENLGNLNRKGKLININHRAHQGSMRR